jgi:hypothetical protein
LEKQKKDAGAKMDQERNVAVSEKPYYGERVVDGSSELDMQRILDQGKLNKIEQNDNEIEARKTERLSFEDLEKSVQTDRTEKELNDLTRMETERFANDEAMDLQRENAIPVLDEYKEKELEKVGNFANVAEVRAYGIDRYNNTADLERSNAENDRDVQRLNNVTEVDVVKEREINKVADFSEVETDRSYGIDRYNNAADLERSNAENDRDEQRLSNVIAVDVVKEREINKVADFFEVETDRSYGIDRYNNAADLDRSTAEKERDEQRLDNIVDMEVVKERELDKTESFVETNRSVTYDNYKATNDLTAKFETFSVGADERRTEETVKQMEQYKSVQEKLYQGDNAYNVNKTDNTNEYNVEMTAKFETFNKDSDIPRQENVSALELYQEKYYKDQEGEIESYTDKSQNTYLEKEKVKEQQFSMATDEDVMRTQNVEDMLDFQEKKYKEDEALVGKFSDAEYDKTQKYDDVKNQKATMFSDENVDPLVGQYKEGVTEEIYQRKNNMGEVIEVTILRIVVTGNDADEYKKVTTRWSTSYFKNGGVITQHIWDTETH